MTRLRFWDTWDDRQKDTAVKATGVAFGLAALFTLISTLSYLFTWKQDMSLLRDPDMLDKATDVANAGGKLGLKWAALLVSDCFGLGSLALVILMCAISVRLIAGRWQHSLIKTATVTVSGAFITSLLCTLAGHFIGIDTLFSSGIGGACGAFVTGGLINLFGSAVTTLMLIAAAAGWLYLISPRFSDWISSLGAKGDPAGSQDKENAEGEAQPTAVETPSAEPLTVTVETSAAAAAASGKTVHDMYYRHTGAGSNTAEDKSQHESAPEGDISLGSGPADNQASSGPGKPSSAAAAEKLAAEPEGSFEIDRGQEINVEVVKELPKINVRLDPPEGLPDFEFPKLELLGDYESTAQNVSDEELNRNNNKIRSTLKNYKIEILDVKAVVGPTVTLYKVYPAPGVKIANIKSLQDDIAMSLNAKGVRIVTLPDSVGIEVANDKASIVPLKGLLNDDAFRNSKAELPVAIGCNIQKKVKVFDLADAPHLLVAGATKQGKSVGLNVLVASLLYSKHPSEMKLVFIDPKMVEFTPYGRLLKHYLAVLPNAADGEEELDQAIVKNPKSAEKVLRSLCLEMDERYVLLSKAFVNNVKLYNERYKDHKLNPEHGHRFLPYLVVIIDEYADLAMSGGAGSEGRAMQKSIMGSIVRLAQKGRAAGVHVVVATQRPSVDVITGLIKANFPSRIAFRVSTRVDSNTILDTTGAEKLIGRGDMLYYAGVETERIQCGFISNDEINALTAWIGNQTGYKKSYNTPYYLPDPNPADQEGGTGGMIDMNELDERFEEAARMVVMNQKGSTSDLQRRLGMGYAKAGRVMDQLEAAGIVGPQEGSKPRAVLVADFDELDIILKAFMK